MCQKKIEGHSEYHCADCGWITGSIVGKSVVECEFCNTYNQQSMKYRFEDVTKRIIKNFFSKNGWHQMIVEDIIFKSGESKFVFRIELHNGKV